MEKKILELEQNQVQSDEEVEVFDVLSDDIDKSAGQQDIIKSTSEHGVGKPA